MVFPLRSKGEVPDVLIPWIRAVRLQLRERFREDLLVLRLHSGRCGEFSSDLLRDFCRGEGILQSFTLSDSPQQNGIAERLIGLVMETGKVGDASVFRVWGSHAFLRDTSLDKLSARAILCVFLGISPDAPGWHFSPLWKSHPLPGTVPVEVAVDSGAARGTATGGATTGGAEPGGAEPGGVEPGGAESEGVGSVGAEPARVESGGTEPEGVEPWGAESGGAEPRGTAFSGGPEGASPQLSPPPEPLSPQQLREWFTQRTRLRITARAGGLGGAAAAGPGGARTRGTGAAGTCSVEDAAAGDSTELGAAGARGTGAGGTSTGVAKAGGAGVGAVSGAGGSVQLQPYFVPVLQQVLGVPSSPGLTPPLLYPPPDLTQPLLQPASTLPAPPYTAQTGGLTEPREPASCPASPVRTGRRVPRPRPPPVPGTHAMALRPSSVPLRVPLPPPPESSLPAIPNPESDRARAASPTVSRLLPKVITDPSFESTAASALVAELVDFAAVCRLDYAIALVATSESASPPSVGGECALSTDNLEDKQEFFECLAAAVPRFTSILLAPGGDPDAPNIPTPRSYAEAITSPYSSQWQTAMDTKMACWKVKRPPGSPPAFKARYVARAFSQRQGCDYFQTFSPTPKMTTLWVLLHLRRPPGFTGSFPAGTQSSLRRPFYGLRQAPHEWHDTLRTTLVALGFTPSTADPSLFLRTNTSLPPFYLLVYVDDLVFATADTEALTLVKSELQKRHTCTDLGELRSYLGGQITRDRARRTITMTQSHMVHQVLQRFGFQFSSPQPTPLSTGLSLSAPPWDESVEPSGPYP
ncbi:unnamed protein product [Closterium sp. NIES-53]